MWRIANGSHTYFVELGLHTETSTLGPGYEERRTDDIHGGRSFVA